MIHFVTGNVNKLREFKAQIPDLEQLELDLEEIQSLDPKHVIGHKLNQAAAMLPGQLIVEDTSLTLHALGRLPGTYIKWFLDSIGLDGIADLASRYPDQSATARTVIGYRDAFGKHHFFTGELEGSIAPPKGKGFGWDVIFVPSGYDRTFGELGPELKQRISMRRRAIDQLRAFLSK
jgi:non-canonical purine NTP pyrophosphatase (RdgB/HAM1 family)